jgi:hypothetical protein
MASPLVDGVRALVSDNGVLVTSDLRPVKNRLVQARYGREDLAGADGILVSGSPPFAGCRGPVEYALGSRDFDFDAKFYVFDHRLDEDLPFRGRQREAQDRAFAAGALGVLHSFVEDEDELRRHLAIVTSQGYRGLVVRDPKAPYLRGRCDAARPWMVKISGGGLR